MLASLEERRTRGLSFRPLSARSPRIAPASPRISQPRPSPAHRPPPRAVWDERRLHSLNAWDDTAEQEAVGVASSGASSSSALLATDYLEAKNAQLAVNCQDLASEVFRLKSALAEAEVATAAPSSGHHSGQRSKSTKASPRSPRNPHASPRRGRRGLFSRKRTDPSHAPAQPAANVAGGEPAAAAVPSLTRRVAEGHLLSAYELSELRALSLSYRVASEASEVCGEDRSRAGVGDGAGEAAEGVAEGMAEGSGPADEKDESALQTAEVQAAHTRSWLRSAADQLL